MNNFTHIDKQGKATMVDVGAKDVTRRKAIARSIVTLPDEVVDKFNEGEIQTKKGAVIQTAVIAGIMAAKKTSELIPLCHPIAIDNCKIDIRLENKRLIIDCTTTTSAKTGVEMEAITGATIAALTIYDMCKAISHQIVIHDIRLLEKSGGKNDFKSE